MTESNQKTPGAKAYLGQIRQIDRTVRRLCDARFLLRSSLYSTGAALTGMPGVGPDPDRTGRTLARLDELERRIDAYVDELVARKAEAFARIRRMPELSEQDVVIARYIQLKSWRQIAQEMRYSEQHIYRLHGAALQHLETSFKDESS